MREQEHGAAEIRSAAAEITLAGYELLRLNRRRWRRLLGELLGPAFRLHDLRSAGTRMWREAFCRIECEARKVQAENHCE